MKWFLLFSLLSLKRITSFQAVDNNADSRRTFLRHTVTLPILSSSFIQLGGKSPANALPLFEKKERRQLELCIVNILRVQYWARNLGDKLQYGETEEERKKAYLEARLGAKAMVADKKIKIGGGASLFVLTLKGLEIKDNLDDLKFYAKTKRMDQYKDCLLYTSPSPRD